jgi:FkbM family methyltransferase
MKQFSRLWYYAISIVTLLTRFERPFQILAIFLNRPGTLPAEIQVKEGGYRFKIREAMDAWVIKETCVDHDYLSPANFQPHWTVVDIGAGLGDFTVFAAKHCPDGVVFAYEPLAESFQLLQHNLALNQISHVKTFQQATASSSGSMTATQEPGKAVSTRFVAETAGADGKEGVIPVISLAEILDRLPDGCCHLLKVDCEGCEFDLLMNSPSKLLAQVERLSVETHDGYTDRSAGQLADYLKQQGFTVHLQANPVHPYLGFLYAERPG